MTYLRCTIGRWNIDLLSGGRLVVGVGPGSSARDYAAVGIPFEERWKPTAGWLLPTTPPRKPSPTPGDDSQNT
jgi:hypothetical protein